MLITVPSQSLGSTRKISSAALPAACGCTGPSNISRAMELRKSLGGACAAAKNTAGLDEYNLASTCGQAPGARVRSGWRW